MYLYNFVDYFNVQHIMQFYIGTKTNDVFKYRME